MLQDVFIVSKSSTAIAIVEYFAFVDELLIKLKLEKDRLLYEMNLLDNVKTSYNRISVEQDAREIKLKLLPIDSVEHEYLYNLFVKINQEQLETHNYILNSDSDLHKKRTDFWLKCKSETSSTNSYVINIIKELRTELGDELNEDFFIRIHNLTNSNLSSMSSLVTN